MNKSFLVCIVVFTQFLSGCSKERADVYKSNLDIVSVNIPVNAINVAINSTISFKFNSPMSSICADCIVLKQWIDNATIKPVAGITMTSGSDLVFTPNLAMQPNTRYYVEISAALNKDNSQLFLSDYTYHSNSSFFFTTGNRHASEANNH